jgi:hypothetical protein
VSVQGIGAARSACAERPHTAFERASSAGQAAMPVRQCPRGVATVCGERMQPPGNM